MCYPYPISGPSRPVTTKGVLGNLTCVVPTTWYGSGREWKFHKDTFLWYVISQREVEMDSSNVRVIID